MQRAADKFERQDPWPEIPFAFDDAESRPSLAELVGWVFLAGSFIGLCVAFLGVA